MRRRVESRRTIGGDALRPRTRKCLMPGLNVTRIARGFILQYDGCAEDSVMISAYNNITKEPDIHIIT